MIRTNCLVAPALCLVMVACEVVDEKDILDATPLFQDTCLDPEAKLESSASPVRLGFRLVSPSTTAPPLGCVLSSPAEGPDGVVLFDSASEQEWRITATPETGDVDLALYVTDIAAGTCNAISCVGVQDRCGVGDRETFAFVAPAFTGSTHRTFALFVDSRSPFSGIVNLVLSSPIRGDGVLSPGEACDDGDFEDGDGCSEEGLEELIFGAANVTGVAEERDNNGDVHLANTVVGLQKFVGARITGTFSGCDDDVFRLPVSTSASVTLSVVSDVRVDFELFVLEGGEPQQLERGSDRRNPVINASSETSEIYYILLRRTGEPGPPANYAIDVLLGDV